MTDDGTIAGLNLEEFHSDTVQNVAELYLKSVLHEMFLTMLLVERVNEEPTMRRTLEDLLWQSMQPQKDFPDPLVTATMPDMNRLISHLLDQVSKRLEVPLTPTKLDS